MGTETVPASLQGGGLGGFYAAVVSSGSKLVDASIEGRSDDLAPELALMRSLRNLCDLSSPGVAIAADGGDGGGGGGMGGTLGVADGGSPSPLSPPEISHMHHVTGKMLRKLGRHSEAVEELRAADRAMQSSPAAERDLPSLALIPDIFATQAVALARQQQSGGGGGGGGGTAQGDWRAMLTAAVSEARAVLALAPDDTFAGRGAGSFKRCDAQVLLARMLFTELGMTPQHEQKAEPDRVKAQAKETFELAAAALKGARHHNDQRVAMLAGQLMQAVQQGAKPNA
jgi:hypothetical protein